MVCVNDRARISVIILTLCACFIYVVVFTLPGNSSRRRDDSSLVVDDDNDDTAAVGFANGVTKVSLPMKGDAFREWNDLGHGVWSWNLKLFIFNLSFSSQCNPTSEYFASKHNYGV